MKDIILLEKKAKEIRKAVVELIYQAQTGHIGGSLSCTDILTALYYGIMRIDPLNPQAPDRDRFILSKGHSIEAYWCILADKGFFPKEELKTFAQFGTRLICHPNNQVAGVEMNTGSLGHGLSLGVGMALAGKKDQADFRVYTLMGDGELAEGSIWEAAMAGSHYQLDNLVGIIDRNRLQISGETEEVMNLEPLADKWQAFGWEVVSIDGNNMQELFQALSAVPQIQGRPTLIIANTVKGKGVSFIENQAGWHHRVPTSDEFKLAMEELERVGVS